MDDYLSDHEIGRAASEMLTQPNPLNPFDGRGLLRVESDLALVRRALQRIANGYRDDSRKKLSHAQIQLLAREACDVIGWPYDSAAAQDAANESG